MQEMQETWVRSLGWGDPLEEEMAPDSSIFLPGKFSGQMSLVGYSPQDHKESDTTESLSTVQFSSVVQSYPTLCDPMDCSTPGLAVHH